MKGKGLPFCTYSLAQGVFFFFPGGGMGEGGEFRPTILGGYSWFCGQKSTVNAQGVVESKTVMNSCLQD